MQPDPGMMQIPRSNLIATSIFFEDDDNENFEDFPISNEELLQHHLKKYAEPTLNQKDKSCISHRFMNTFQHEEDKVEFKLFKCLYKEI